MAESASSPATTATNKSLKLRRATKADLGDIVRIVKHGFPDDPGCEYKFPHRDRHPDDFKYWVRQEYQGYLEQPEKYAFLLVTAPVEEDGETVDKPIALGIWDISPMKQPAARDCHFYERKDMNLAHYAVYGEAMARGFDEHFAVYEDSQTHLWMLMTHPDFRRRGAGTMLCNWGREEAIRRESHVLTLMASPMGRALYQTLGYKRVATKLAQICGEDEKVDIHIMQLTLPRGETTESLQAGLPLALGGKPSENQNAKEYQEGIKKEVAVGPAYGDDR